MGRLQITTYHSQPTIQKQSQLHIGKYINVITFLKETCHIEHVAFCRHCISGADWSIVLWEKVCQNIFSLLKSLLNSGLGHQQAILLSDRQESVCTRILGRLSLRPLFTKSKHPKNVWKCIDKSAPMCYSFPLAMKRGK